jgi:hypothetical protein
MKKTKNKVIYISLKMNILKAYIKTIHNCFWSYKKNP